MINPLVCRSQHRSSVGAVAMGHRDWALQLEMTEWQVHARFKCGAECGEGRGSLAQGRTDSGLGLRKSSGLVGVWWCYWAVGGRPATKKKGCSADDVGSGIDCLTGRE